MKASELIEIFGRPCGYHPKLRAITGTIASVLFLENFLYWEGKGKCEDDWIYKTSEEIELETGLSYKEQVGARKRLKSLGLLEERAERLHHLMFYRVNIDKLDEICEQMGFSRTDHRAVRETTSGQFGNRPEGSSIIITSHTTSSTTSSPTGPKPKPLDERSSMKKTIIEKYNQVALKRKWVLVPVEKKIRQGDDDLLNTFLDDFDRVEALDEYCEKVSTLDWAEACRIAFFLRRKTFDKVMSGEWGPSRESQGVSGGKKDEDPADMSPEMRKAYYELTKGNQK